MPTEPSRVRRQLGYELKRARTAAGLALRAFTEQNPDVGRRGLVPIPHPRLQRAERGEALLTDDQLVTFLALVDPEPEVRERVEVLNAHGHSEQTRWSLVMGDSDQMQDVAADREQVTGLYSCVEVAWLPGLLQTAAYASALFQHLPEALPAGHDVAEAVAGRMRRQELLFRPGRTFRFLLTPRLLEWAPDPEVSMDAQRDRIAQLAALDAVTVRMLNAADRMPMSGFVVHDQMEDGTAMVVLELEDGDLTLAKPEDVDRYRRVFNRLFGSARPL